MQPYSQDLRERVIAALPLAHGSARKLQTAEAFIRAEVKRQPDVTLAELCERVAETQGVQASVSAMGRMVHHLNLRRKKSRFTIASATRRA